MDQADKVPTPIPGHGFLFRWSLFIKRTSILSWVLSDQLCILVDVFKSQDQIVPELLYWLDWLQFSFNHIPRETDTVLSRPSAFTARTIAPKGVTWAAMTVALLVCGHTRNGHIRLLSGRGVTSYPKPSMVLTKWSHDLTWQKPVGEGMAVNSCKLSHCHRVMASKCFFILAWNRWNNRKYRLAFFNSSGLALGESQSSIYIFNIWEKFHLGTFKNLSTITECLNSSMSYFQWWNILSRIKIW